jgi:maltose alpha-D-glucosyltransferase/alpha-amylase
VVESNSDGIVFDAAGSVDVGRVLFEAIATERSFKSQHSSGRLVGVGSELVKSQRNGHALKAAVAFTDQGNTTVIYDDKFVLKLFRRIEPGIHPGLEAAQFLADKNLPQVPPYAGALEFERPGAWRACLGILSGFVSGTDGWQFTLDTLGLYFDRVRTLACQPPDNPSQMSVTEFVESVPSYAAAELIGSYFESARLLGQRTGELHLALASRPDNKEFAPEPFTPFYQRSLYQSLRNHLTHQVRMLRRDLRKLPESVQPLAEKVIGLQSTIIGRYAAIYKTPMEAERIRCHGNFHLGHVLYTGKDFVIIDFEGEPTRSLSERRIKRSPLRDVAAMMYSFGFAAHAALAQQRDAGAIHAEQTNLLREWARFWSRQVNCAFLNAYRTATDGSSLLPKTKEGLAVLLEAFLLDQSITELGRLWYCDKQKMGVPLQGILRIIGQDPNV